MKHRRQHLIRISLILIIGLALSPPAAPQDKPEVGAVSIPWEEFRKLLELDKDEFVLSWQEFQKILRQTGLKFIPPHKLKDEKVVLTRAQFTNLLNRMKPPVDPVVKPPAEYLLTKAFYTGRIGAGSADFRADFNVEIFEQPAARFVKIPFLPVQIALKEALFDGKPALMVIESNRHTLTTRETGRHRIAVDFSLKAPIEQGPRTLSFPIPRTAITVFEVDIPFKDIEVEMTNAQKLEITERRGGTHIAALLSPCDVVNLHWRRKPPEVEKGPAKIYAETINLLSIEEDALRISTTLTLSILQNSISTLTLQVPQGYSILDVKGTGIEDWREITSDGIPYLEIPLAYAKSGGLSLNIIAEKLLPGPSMAVEFQGFRVQGAIREKGFLGVSLKSASEVTLSEMEGLDKLDVSELPAALIGRSRKPLLLGFKYLHHPYSLVLEIKKHEALPVIGTVVDSASGVTLFTEDGKLVHRIVYQIRNTSKQFLELELPRDARIWSVFVGGEPAKPRLSGSRILIPLNRSAQGATGLVAFDVELIYFQKSERFGRLGLRESMFPVPDIIISQMLWSVYLPEGYRYAYFGGSVEKEKTARGIRPLLGGTGKESNIRKPRSQAPGEGKDEEDKLRAEAGRLKKRFSSNLALSEEQLVRQMENEARFSQRMDDIQSGAAPAGGGILPIRIQIPATGRLFRFAKTIISEEPLTLSFNYVSGSVLSLAKVLALLIILLTLFLLRGKIRQGLGNLPLIKKRREP